TLAPSARTASSEEVVSAAARELRTRTGVSPIAPKIAARWEIDLWAGGVSSPSRRDAGSKRTVVWVAMSGAHREAEVGQELLRARRGVRADPQGDLAAGEVGGRRERHVGVFDALTARPLGGAGR